MEFGEYLREMRIKKHYKTVKLAKLIEISPSYLSCIEGGRRSAPSFDIIKKIADVLEMDVEERHKLYDLAAKSRKPKTLAYDMTEYIINNPNLHKLLRYSMRCNLTEKDWKKIFEYIKRNYFY